MEVLLYFFIGFATSVGIAIFGCRHQKNFGFDDLGCFLLCIFLWPLFVLGGVAWLVDIILKRDFWNKKITNPFYKNPDRKRVG